MALAINTNIMSLTAQRNLAESMGPLQQAMQRLSSGLRINAAQDDAAGLAIATRMSAQIGGLNQAIRNTNDGISLLQTGEGAMTEITTNLQRIRVLAVQSVNATNTPADRASLQAEVTQLISEIDRVATQTSFNGAALLDGTFTNQTFQVGANVGETITIDAIVNARTAELGHLDATVTGGRVNTVAIAGTGDLMINTTNVIVFADDTAGSNFSALAKI